MGREAGAPGEDAAVARAVHLAPDALPAAGDPETAALERERRALELRIGELKARRSEVSDEQYRAELAPLLLELARVTRQIRERS